MFNNLLIFVGMTVYSNSNIDSTSASINFSAEIVSQQNIEIATEQIISGIDDCYKLKVFFQSSGYENAGILRKDFLVFDGRLIDSNDKLIIEIIENEIVVNTSQDFIVLNSTFENELIVKNLVYDKYFKSKLVVSNILKKVDVYFGFYFD